MKNKILTTSLIAAYTIAAIPSLGEEITFAPTTIGSKVISSPKEGIAAYTIAAIPSLGEEITFDPIVVGADFRDQNLSQVASSVSIISEADIYDKAAQSFAEIVAAEPNVNFSSGASKAKFIQIRGIGERSQFVTPINPSVGIILDGIDFSQSALGVTMYDLKQIEVLRGPQGTTFGANGMAGVINIESNDPTAEAGGHLEATAGNYNTKA